MIFFFSGRPSALFMYQTSFIWLSLASEPELQKNTFEIGTGAISFSFSASSIAGIVALGREQVREGQLAHLRRRGLDQLLVVVAERRAPQAGHAFEIGLAVGVVDVDALAALDHQRTGFADRRLIGSRDGCSVSTARVWRLESGAMAFVLNGFPNAMRANRRAVQ